MKKYIVLIVTAAFCSSLMSAQSKIDKVIDSMEGKSDVETTYTERRSPKKKKLIMTSRIFNFTNTYYFEKLNKAFEEERSNSISAVKTKNQMTYRFDNDKGISSYTLSWTGANGPYTMVMTWRSPEAGDTSYLEENGDLMGLEDASGSVMVYTTDSYGCPVNLVLGSDGYYDRDYQRAEARKEAKRAREQAAEARKAAAQAREEARKAAAHARADAAKARAEARKQASKARAQAQKAAAQARVDAAKARTEAAKARAKARKEASKARAEAQKARAKARREAAQARRKYAASDKTEDIYELASRARCSIVSPAGVVTEMSALDALDNDDVWKALETAAASDRNGKKVVVTSVAGTTTTVTIDSAPESI